MMDVINTILAVVLVVNFGLGLLILYHGERKNVKGLYSAMIFVVFGWTLCMMMYRGSGPETQLFWARMLYFTASFTSTTFFFFVYYFPQGKPGLSRPVWIGILLWNLIYASVILFTNTVVTGVDIRPGMEKLIHWGPLYWIYPAHILVFFLLAYWHLYFNKVRKSTGLERLQNSLVFWGFFIAGNIAFTTNLSIPSFGNTALNWVGQVATTAMLVTTAYAILKLHLMNIKLIIAEIVTYLAMVALAAEVFLSKTLLEGLFRVLFFTLMLYAGTVLIRSMKKEISQKEQLQKLASQLEAANAHLKDLDKLKDDFLSMAAHELNTPLAAIEGYLSMILDEHIGGAVPLKVQKYLESMYSSSKRLAAIIHDMLNVSRIESNRIHLVYSHQSIVDVIAEALVEIDPKIKEQKHQITFIKPEKKISNNWFDKTRITEVLINLLGNAAKFTNPGGKIVVKVTADDNSQTISVQDNGRGIPEDRKKAIFEKFSQVDILRDEVKGTGLGMYIAKKFIELHKGKIWFDSSVSENDHGTTFYFTLPILKEKPFDPHEGEGEVLH